MDLSPAHPRGSVEVLVSPLSCGKGRVLVVVLAGFVAAVLGVPEVSVSFSGLPS